MAFQYGLTLENFKIFNERENIYFAPLTVLTGANGTGKSTFNQALRLLNSHFSGGVYSPEDKSIKLHSLLKLIDPNDIEAKIGEFENYLNKKGERRSFTIGMPADVDTYHQSLVLMLEFVSSEMELSMGILNVLTLSEKETGIDIMTLKRTDDDKYSCKINFERLYGNYRRERGILNQIREAVRERDRFVHGMGMSVPEEIDRRVKTLAGSLFGDLDVEFSMQSHDLTVEYPSFNHSFGTEDSFDEQNRLNRKEALLVNGFVMKWMESGLLVDVEEVYGEGNEHKFISDILSRNMPSEKISDEMYDRCNLHFLKIMSEHEYNVASLERPSQSISTYRHTAGMLVPYDKSLGQILKKNEVVSGSALSEKWRNENIVNDFSVIPDYKTMSSFGFDFFTEYVDKTIMKAIGALNHYKYVNFIDGTIDMSGRRSIMISRENRGINYIMSLDDGQRAIVLEFIRKWVREFGIGDDFSYEKSGASVTFHIHKGGIRFNLADDGFGVSRILPILLQIGQIATRNYLDFMKVYTSSTMVVEEPEIGLHPALQSRLADMFHDAYKTFNIQSIIETHSEYLIRRMQVLVAQGDMLSSDVQIYYLNHPDRIKPGDVQVCPINITDSGSLTRGFGTGFFDESSNLNVALYMSSEVQKN